MTRTVVALSVVVLLSVASPVFSQPTFTEAFDSPTLDERLRVSISSGAFGVAPFTPGATWQATKQAGTSSGFVEIKTRFEVDGDFSAELQVDRANLGTGEVGIRLGEIWDYPFTEIFLQGLDSVRGNIYHSSAGHGLAGFDTFDEMVTLRIVRTNDRVDYYSNGRLFLISEFAGPTSATIFLRPHSGNGQFNPNIGQPDPHAALLGHFSLTADRFVPEPSSLAIILWMPAVVWTVRRKRVPLTG